jgi:hypothetical protein
MVATAQLPEFGMTPASVRALEDLYLGARTRLALARDRNTCNAAVKVIADGGVVTVAYLPQDVEVAPHIQQVLADVQGIDDLR